MAHPGRGVLDRQSRVTLPTSGNQNVRNGGAFERRRFCAGLQT